MIVQKELVNVEDEGLISLIGQEVTLFCLNYFYNGKLVGVNKTCVKLQDAKIIYETGCFSNRSWKDAQSLHNKFHYIQTGAIESFGVFDKE